ncbi:bis(5'-nucleosyl)-tetraphosphatase (symmetrical) YqeK [bacterium]
MTHNTDGILKKLKTFMTEKRLEHSKSVAEIGVKLAEKYGADTDKVYLAGLLHDVAKDIPFAHLSDYGVDVKLIPDFDELLVCAPAVIHSHAGDQVCRKFLGIDDEEILHAVKVHTTGSENMNIIDKIIYIADCIEPLRDFEGTDHVRKIAFEHIDRALEEAFALKIKGVLEYRGVICPDSIKAWNGLMKKGCAI